MAKLETLTLVDILLDLFPLLTFSVAVALAGVFAILINKIYKIMEIFE